MKEINEYVNSLSTEKLVEIYEKEYLPFKKTGILSDGEIRKISRMLIDIMGVMDIRFAEKLIIERCAEIFYNQNKKLNF
jgi:hypothetical protein